MKRFILILFSLLVAAALVVSCSGVMPIGSVQVAPAPQISTIPQASPQSDSMFVRFQKAIEQLFPKKPQVNSDGRAKKLCDEAAEQIKEANPKLWEIETLPLDSPEIVLKKTRLRIAISLLSGPLCKEWYSVLVVNDIFTVVGSRSDAAPVVLPLSFQEIEISDLATKGKTDQAKAKCQSFADFINSGKFEQFWFVIKVGDTEAVQLKKKGVFDALEILGGKVCSRWFSVRVIGGVYVIVKK